MSASNMRLRELIKAVRSCKTSAEERAVIARESAKIRTSFAQNETEYKPRNIAKLLYIHMLGYPTQFGALETIALCAQPQFTAKRIGYLGLMLLLDEDTELLMMVTNSLRLDLKHLNQFVVGLALSSLANVGSAGMARDLAPDIEQLLGSPNTYIRKKAALCAVRIVRKVPEMAERYAARVRALLADKNHAVLLTGLQLLIELCELDHSYISMFKEVVPSLVALLKNLVMSGYAPEYEVSGICDPFLQVKVLRALCVLGTRDVHASDAMNDILAQVTTNTESLRNVGNAVLYEAVRTIMTIEANDGLRTLAINILGRFLSQRDNNIRYVALNTLGKVVHTNFSAVQRHRTVIVDCLKDPDISIRRRALDLVYSLVNRKNIRPLVGELLGYLLVADEELRPDITAKLCMVTGRFAPTKKWHVDTILRVMLLAGQYIPEDVIGDTVALVTQSVEVQPYAVRRFFSALKKEPAKKPLVYVAVWFLGEFGDMLVQPDGDDYVLNEAEVVDMLRKVVEHPSADDMTRVYVLSALGKLAARFSPTQQSAINALLDTFKSSIDLEVQTRAVELSALIGLQSSQLQTVMDRVPPLVLHGDEPFEHQQYSDDEGGATGDAGLGVLPAAERTHAAPAAKKANPAGPAVARPAPPAAASTSLIDLEGLLSATPSPAAAPMGGLDLLSSLMPVAPAQVAGPAAPAVPAPVAAPSGVEALLSLSTAAPNTPVVAPPPAPIVAFDKHGVKVVMQFAPQPDGVLFVQLVSTNAGQDPVKSFTLLMAVPTYVKLQMAAPSGNVIAPGGKEQVTQQVRIENTEKPLKPTLVKIKVDFVTQHGGKFSEVVNVAAFPTHL